jgi:hypothetical protein
MSRLYPTIEIAASGRQVNLSPQLVRIIAADRRRGWEQPRHLNYVIRLGQRIFLALGCDGLNATLDALSSHLRPGHMEWIRDAWTGMMEDAEEDLYPIA